MTCIHRHTVSRQEVDYTQYGKGPWGFGDGPRWIPQRWVIRCEDCGYEFTWAPTWYGSMTTGRNIATRSKQSNRQKVTA